MNKKRNRFILIVTAFLFIYAGSITTNAATNLENNFSLPKEASSVCSVNGQLIYRLSNADYDLNYYSYNPTNKKSSFLGKIPAVGRSSGDYVLVSNRYLFTCIPIDKRITKDAKILRRPDEVIRIICIDLEKSTTTEVLRFSSLTDLVHVEPIDDNKILIYGRVAENSGVIKTCVDEFNIKDKKLTNLISATNQDISAATYDNGKIYTINEDWGATWPFDVDRTHKPIYSLNRYDVTGNPIDTKTLELNSLFVNEEGASTSYRSFMELSVSGSYFKLNTFGSESVLFTFTNNGTLVTLYSGDRLTCWNDVSSAFKEGNVYFTNLGGDSYLLTKENNRLDKQQQFSTNGRVYSMLWDGKSDYLFAAMWAEGASGRRYAIVPTPALQPESENEIATNALASQLIGDGKGSTGVALFIGATTGYHKELNRTDGLLFLSKIGLDSFVAAEMKVEIPIPDAMIGIIEDNYISIGMPHTSTLYIYRDYEQAVVVGENKLYYDVPAGTYQAILELLL